MHRFLFSAVLVAAGFVGAVQADFATLTCDADTTLIELEPDNNMGGHVFFNAGSTFHGNRNRGLLRFDVRAAVPAGSVIKSAQLIVEVVGIPIDEPAGANFRLHRVLYRWCEGTNVSFGGPGRGDLATTNQVTWNHRFALTTNIWSIPGGLAGTDFVVAYSAEQFIEPINNLPYAFGSSPGMVEDVQTWLDAPTSNFGWLLKIEDEEARTTARRFASREDFHYGPQLLVEFDPPPRLIANQVGSELHIEFVAKPNEAYVFQKANSLGASWNSISNIAATTESRTIHLTNFISGTTGFFRLLVEE